MRRRQHRQAASITLPAVLRMADIVVVAKCNSAAEADIRRVTESAHVIAPGAKVVAGQVTETLSSVAATVFSVTLPVLVKS